jgi:hypothetical protein
MEQTAEFSMRLLDEAVINRRRRIGGLVRGMLVLAGFAAAAWAAGRGLSRGHAPVGPLNWVMLVVHSSACGLLGAVVFWLAFVRPLISLLHLVAEDYDWLAESECLELAELCEKTPGLVAYRDQVRAANRRFTSGESDAMFSWASEQEYLRQAAEETRARAGCQRLYGIEQS